MIRDAWRQADISHQWTVIERLVHWNRSAIGAGPVFVVETPPEEFFNLPLVLAYSCLEDALNHLIEECHFACAGRWLDDKMKAARNAGLFIDYAELELGRAARNEIAHEGALHDKKTCVRFVDAIGYELRSLKIIP